jgi:hypothetical protein
MDAPGFRTIGFADATVKFEAAMNAAATRRRDGIIN